MLHGFLGEPCVYHPPGESLIATPVPIAHAVFEWDTPTETEGPGQPGRRQQYTGWCTFETDPAGDHYAGIQRPARRGRIEHDGHIYAIGEVIHNTDEGTAMVRITRTGAVDVSRERARK